VIDTFLQTKFDEMAEKKLSNGIHKNNHVSPVKKRLRILRVSFMHLMIFSGIVLILVIYSAITSKKLNGEKSVHLTSENPVDRQDINTQDEKYRFINPKYSGAENHILYTQIMSFKNTIETYCQKTQKDQSIRHISVYFRDLSNDFWFGINENEKFAPASLSKVPILIAVLQKAENDPAYLHKKLQFNGSFEQDYLAQHPEIQQDRSCLVKGKQYTIEELADYMITRSDNEATKLIMADIGFPYLNALNKKLGYFEPQNATSSSNLITVKNYSAFFRSLYNSSILSKKMSDKALEILSRTNYSKGIRQAVPSDITISQKFGERDTFLSATEVAIMQLHQAAIVYLNEKPYFLCIMTKGNDKQKMEKILFDIGKITYNEVVRQVNAMNKPQLIRDIE